MTDTEREQELLKRYSLDDIVTAIDADGNHYSRKIRVGLKRGEMYLERGKDGVPCAFLKAEPTGINVINFKTHKRERVPLESGTRLCFALTEEAFFDAQCCPLRMVPRNCVNREKHEGDICDCGKPVKP